MKPITSFTLLLALAAPLAACGPVDAKGDEDNALAEDGKVDSWFNPTEQGDMRFTAPNEAALTDDEQFHSWTFTLTDDAELDLRTEGEMNLDTVMYLYRRDPGEDRWGRYVRKNDDDGSLVSSRITHDAVAGEYRVIVKGYKTRLRGPFALIAECAGDGCNADTGMCEADDFRALPAARDWSLNCAAEITGMLSGPRTVSSSSSIELANKCDLRGLERDAIDYYVSYWSEFVDFEAEFNADGDGVFLDFYSTRYEGGTAVFVSAGGDEDGLEMYFDESDTLLASYQHNQSPTVDYYCDPSMDALDFDAPDEWCFNLMVETLPRDTQSAMDGNANVTDASATHLGLGAAMERFIETYSLDRDEVIEYELVTWSSLDHEQGLSVNFYGPDDETAEYTMYQAMTLDSDWIPLFITDPNGIVMTCERL